MSPLSCPLTGVGGEVEYRDYWGRRDSIIAKYDWNYSRSKMLVTYLFLKRRLHCSNWVNEVCSGNCEVCYRSKKLFSAYGDSKTKKCNLWEFHMVQWLGTCLIMQGTWVQSLVLEDPTCLTVTKPVCHNYWSPHALVTKPVCHNYWSPHALEPASCK